jgi:CheY-like chemotaxis protein
MGCQVDLVDNGLAACRALQNTTYDLALLDGLMPAMSGFEATRRIRSCETNGRRTPIVALLSAGGDNQRENAYEAGMDDFVTKPISGRAMERVLDHWLAQ